MVVLAALRMINKATRPSLYYSFPETGDFISSMASVCVMIIKAISVSIFLLGIAVISLHLSAEATEDPTPTPWPHQFHSILVMNFNGTIEIIDLWYDWPNGRNFNIIQSQLGQLRYDLEWNNGTSFFYTLDSTKQCSTSHLEVGILRPNWLDGANYLGQQTVDGFLCNVWEKADFIHYYEDVATKRPVRWVFYTGRTAHVMTFEVGAMLEDAGWQAPVYCFDTKIHAHFPRTSLTGVLRASSVAL